MSDDRSHVERLAEAWNATPDYAPSEYDRGRVDQRHDMTMEMFEAIEADRAAGWLVEEEVWQTAEELRAEVERLREAIRHESKHVADRDAMIADLRSRLDEQRTMTAEYKASNADLGERLNKAEDGHNRWRYEYDAVRSDLRNMGVERNMLRITTKELTDKLAEVREWVRTLPDGYRHALLAVLDREGDR